MWQWLERIFNREPQDECLIERFQGIVHTGNQPSSSICEEEQSILKAIRNQTAMNNCNNLARTNAYLNFYQQHREIHWAFLAHMVSRNGGWSMTDVGGSLLQPVLSNRKARAFFNMFERSNWLIFGDAYPQLLLYAESLRRRKPLFHLLPLWGVSRFMVAIWQHFWEERDPFLLTTALIINEQQYIEKRVVKHPFYRRAVMQTVLFKLQTAFDFNQVVFPVGDDSRYPRLIGRTMHNFANKAHRIKTGRLLYRMLFHPDYFERVYDWAVNHPHTGSRADYWPERFTRQTPARRNRTYSPSLSAVWPNVIHRPAEAGDWYVGRESLSAVVDVSSESEPHFDMTDVYERSYYRLRVISILARTKQLFMQKNKSEN